MKSGATQNCNRRNSFRLSPEHSVESVFKSPAAFFWLVLHGLCCIVSLVLGFRFSRLIFLLIFSSSGHPETPYHRAGSRLTSLETTTGGSSELDLKYPYNVGTPTVDTNPPNKPPGLTQGKSSRVHVGRHGILIRPWPHPDRIQVMKAHQLLERVQQEQRLIYGVKDWRTVIVITPTYLRTFQSVHLTGLMHTLMVVPGKLVWIVVEAGGVSNETASLLGKTGLPVIHGESGWVIDTPLEIVVPAKRTPWPDPPPERPRMSHLTGDNTMTDHTEKHRGKVGKSSKTKRSSHQSNKRKHDTQIEAQQVSRVSERDGTNR